MTLFEQIPSATVILQHYRPESPTMQCPKCAAIMEQVTFDSVTVDRCTGCKGIWFEANEQKWLKEKKGSEAIDSGDAAVWKKMDKITNILCPRCHGPMIR